MGLRKHQSEMNYVIDGIISRSPRFKDIKKIILSVVAGGGKGSVPVNAGKLIMAGLADSICCVVPRQSLQQQCEEVFMDPFFTKLFGVNLAIRASTNEHNPCRGMYGFVTTYQALGHDKQKYVLREIKKKRYVVILDEFHHVEEDSPWHKAVNEIIDSAAFIIMMSGTLSRANKKRIACMKYVNGYVDLSGSPKTHVIRYSRTDAIQEQAILPLEFHLHDGEFEWREHGSEKVKSVFSFNQVKITDRSSALYTALQTNFAEQMMDACLAHWLSYKKDKPTAKALFVCARIDDARRSMAYLDSLGVPSLLATSHDSAACQKNIDAFKADAPALVTIAVAYEGLDVPPVSHVCVLTRIRSKEWMEQCVSRATRIDKHAGSYRAQTAHIFAPKDLAFMEFVEVIEKEQCTKAIMPKEKEEQLPLFPIEPDPAEGGGETGPCIPIKSQIRDLSKMVIGRVNMPYQPVPKMTPKQQELDIRKRIDRHLKKYAYDQGYEYPMIMREAQSISGGKPRALLTLPELEILWTRVQQRFPIKNRGQYIPPSKCPPVFDQAHDDRHVLVNERFF